jgi:hypothetical protein
MRHRLIRSLAAEQAAHGREARVEPLLDQVLAEQPSAEGAIALVLSLTEDGQLAMRTAVRLRGEPSKLSRTDLVTALRVAANTLEQQK